MSIFLKDPHLESEISKVQSLRGDATPTKTTRALLIERITQIKEREASAPISDGDLDQTQPTTPGPGVPKTTEHEGGTDRNSRT